MLSRFCHWWQQYFAGVLDTPSKIVKAAQNEAKQGESREAPFARAQALRAPTPRFDIPERLAMPSIMTAHFVLKQHERADWQQCDKRIMIFSARFIEEARKKGIPLYVHGAFRTKEQQQEMKDRGVSNTTWPYAAHCQGAAVDIVHSQFHWEMTDDEWAYLGKLGREVARRHGFDLIWGANQKIGGDWKKQHDPAHWAVRGWSDHVRETHSETPVRLTPRAMLKRFPNSS